MVSHYAVVKGADQLGAHCCIVAYPQLVVLADETLVQLESSIVWALDGQVRYLLLCVHVSGIRIGHLLHPG